MLPGILASTPSQPQNQNPEEDLKIHALNWPVNLAARVKSNTERTTVAAKVSAVSQSVRAQRHLREILVLSFSPFFPFALLSFPSRARDGSKVQSFFENS